jgi:hypothetical protein
VAFFGVSVVNFLNDKGMFYELEGIRQEGKIQIGGYEISVQGKDALRKVMKGIRGGEFKHYVDRDGVDYYVFTSSSLIGLHLDPIDKNEE